MQQQRGLRPEQLGPPVLFPQRGHERTHSSCSINHARALCRIEHTRQGALGVARLRQLAPHLTRRGDPLFVAGPDRPLRDQLGLVV